MRILIITTFFPPLNSIASLRPYSWAKYWTLAGHEVDVLTVERPNSECALHFSNPGFNVIALPEKSWIKTIKGFFKQKEPSFKATTKGSSWKSKITDWQQKRGFLAACRMPDLTDFWILPAIKQAKSLGKTWDLVVSTSGPYAPHLVAKYLRTNSYAKQWIADFRDLWTDHHIFEGLLAFRFIERKLEALIVKHADHITVVSPGMVKIFQQKYPRAHVHLVENGYDPEDYQQLEEGSIFPKDERLRVVYTGTFQLGKRDPSAIFEAIQKLSTQAMYCQVLNKLELIFAGPGHSSLHKLVEKYQVDKWVKIMGMVNRPDALRMQRDAHLLLFFDWDDPSSHYVLTGKLFEYLYSRTPILATGVSPESDPGQLILAAKAGKLCRDQTSIIASLQDLLRNDLKKTTDHEFIASFERKQLAHKLLQITT